ncbi:hypothetical protein BDF21DRAFT_418995, partial [Thamnidium elegans]|uniref:U1-type domain-containing protein n=1 Tax=Thamnidium elegans TaxID=101142 RepID=A0A8H7SX08_9FUNG
MSSKADVRRLLKKQQTERNKESKVTHPFAKYDETNRLICIVCNSPVKSQAVWQAHLGSTVHRDNIQKLKTLKQQQQQQQQQQSLKRKAPSPPQQDTKRSRMEEIELDEQESSEEEEEDQDQDQDMGLPSDFFDSAEPIEEDEEEEQENNGSIPTGFFDDPEEEARIQGHLAPEEQAQVNLEKDLEAFNDAMIDVTKESKQEQDQDDETFWLERHEDISREQALLDQRVEKLKLMRQQGQLPHHETQTNDDMGLKSSVRQLLKSKVVQHTKSMFDDDDESDSEEEDWRAQQL